jgi:hypothetical protein
VWIFLLVMIALLRCKSFCCLPVAGKKGLVDTKGAFVWDKTPSSATVN